MVAVVTLLVAVDSRFISHRSRSWGTSEMTALGLSWITNKMALSPPALSEETFNNSYIWFVSTLNLMYQIRYVYNICGFMFSVFYMMMYMRHSIYSMFESFTIVCFHWLYMVILVIVNVTLLRFAMKESIIHSLDSFANSSWTLASSHLSFPFNAEI